MQNLATEQNSTITELEDKATLHLDKIKSQQLQIKELEKKNTDHQKKFIELQQQLKKQKEEINGLKQSVSSSPSKKPTSIKKRTITSKKTNAKKPTSQSKWKTFTLTFYSNSPDQGTNGVTASGNPTIEGRTIACDPSIMPLGTVVEIEGFGQRVCEDTGSAINGRILDVFVESKTKAFKLGRQQRNVRVIK